VRRDRVVFGSTVGETFESGDEIIAAGRDRDVQEFSRSTSA
jgi:hypothetical protein